MDPAEIHRPTDRRGFMSAAVAMRTAGQRLDDICTALRLSRNAVLDLLYEYDRGEPRHQTAAPGRRPLPTTKDEP